MKESKNKPKKPTKTDNIKRAMVAALEKSLGIVTTAVRTVGIARSTHYDWMQDDAEYRAAVEGISDIALDFAETKLHKQIEKGDTTATIFYLKTKGKKRGYIERTEHDLTTKGESLNVHHDLSKLTDKELKDLEKLTSKLQHKS